MNTTNTTNTNSLVKWVTLIGPNTLFNLINREYKYACITDPMFLLLLDARTHDHYSESHIITAQLAKKNKNGSYMVPTDYELHCRDYIVVYDHQTSSTDVEELIDTPALSCAKIMWDHGSRSSVQVLNGGYKFFSSLYPFLRTRKMYYLPKELDDLATYPIEVIPGHLYIGRREHAERAYMQKDLKISRHVNCSSCPSRLFPQISRNILTLDLQEVDNMAIYAKFQTVCDFIEFNYNRNKGVLVYSDHGVIRDATIVMAYLIYDNMCSFEVAYDFLKSCVPKICISNKYKPQLVRWAEDVKLNPFAFKKWQKSRESEFLHLTKIEQMNLLSSLETVELCKRPTEIHYDKLGYPTFQSIDQYRKASDQGKLKKYSEVIIQKKRSEGILTAIPQLGFENDLMAICSDKQDSATKPSKDTLAEISSKVVQFCPSVASSACKLVSIARAAVDTKDLEPEELEPELFAVKITSLKLKPSLKPPVETKRRRRRRRRRRRIRDAEEEGEEEEEKDGSEFDILGSSERVVPIRRRWQGEGSEDFEEFEGDFDDDDDWEYDDDDDDGDYDYDDDENVVDRSQSDLRSSEVVFKDEGSDIEDILKKDGHAAVEGTNEEEEVEGKEEIEEEEDDDEEEDEEDRDYDDDNWIKEKDLTAKIGSNEIEISIASGGMRFIEEIPITEKNEKQSPETTAAGVRDENDISYKSHIDGQVNTVNVHTGEDSGKKETGLVRTERGDNEEEEEEEVENVVVKVENGGQRFVETGAGNKGIIAAEVGVVNNVDILAKVHGVDDEVREGISLENQGTSKSADEVKTKGSVD